MQVEGGSLSGVSSPDGVVRAFKGIPYARAPVGDLRWRAPQRVEPWHCIRPADEFSPRCIQPSRAENSIGFFGTEPEREDCLYLNVWTAAVSNDEKRPVMVWFHGGAYYLGSGALSIFNGENLARNGVVLVTVNFRLGRLGFLAHPELSGESPHRSSGNYGLLDQLAALRWVQENIAAFGGDPERVTPFGQSVGSFSVSCFMISPLAKGLFQRAIGQSGAAFGPVTDSSGTGDCTQSLAHAEQSGLALARALGAGTIADLRARPARELQLAFRGEGPNPGAVFDPSLATPGAWDTSYAITDGYVLPESGYKIFAEGRQNDVPLLTGTTANEGATMPATKTLQAYVARARAEFGDMADSFLRLYPAATDGEAGDASKTAIGDRNFIAQNWIWVRMQAQTGKSKAWYYRFNRVPPIPASANYLENPADGFGAFHGAEIPYVYRNFAARNWPWLPADRNLSDSMSSYWVNFAANGDPNGAGLPAWPAFDPLSQSAMCFGETPAIGPIPHRERLAFWDAWYTRTRF